MSLNPYDTPTERRRSLAETTRRQFLGFMGLFVSIATLVLGGFQTLKFMFPNATLEDPPQFKVREDPSTITVGNPLPITDKRVTVVRDNGGYYAVYLVCTHLGCTPNYISDVATNSGDPKNTDRAKKRGLRNADQQKADGWACPCHGSRYFIDSTNFYGPAPRPMDWVKVSKAPDGRLLVDRSVIVSHRDPADTTPPTWRFDYDKNAVVQLDASQLVNS